MAKTKTWLWIGLLFWALSFGYALGTMSPALALAKDGTYEKLGIFAKVLHYVNTNYVEEVPEENLIYGAIKGMLDTLDPHTVFMPPDVYREMKIDTTGEFQGLGLVVEPRDRRLVVVNPIEQSPAEEAGLLRGDIILAIDGKDTTDMSLQDAVLLMRGPAGTQVRLTVDRAGLTKPKDYLIGRRRIHVVSVESKLLEPTVGYIRIKSFQDRTSSQMASALQRMAAKAQGQLDGLVLDLRDNPGGFLEEAVSMADEFLDDGVIVTTEGRNHSHIEVEKAHKSGLFVKGRLAVLINGGSASAAEIVAGALQDHKRAVLFGTKSFGKGSVQNIIDLDDGSGLKITVARYFTPNRRSIDAIGIEPDVVVAQPDAVFHAAELPEGALPAAQIPVSGETGLKLLSAVKPPQTIGDEDHQLRAAYAYLKLGKLL